MEWIKISVIWQQIRERKKNEMKGATKLCKTKYQDYGKTLCINYLSQRGEARSYKENVLDIK